MQMFLAYIKLPFPRDRTELWTEIQSLKDKAIPYIHLETRNLLSNDIF